MRRAGLRVLAALPRRTRTTDSRDGYPIAQKASRASSTPQTRAGQSPRLRFPGPRAAELVWIHRGLPTFPAPALSTGLYQLRRGRMQRDLTPSTFAAEDQSDPDS